MIETGKQVTVEELIEDLSTADRLLQLDAFLINQPQVECPLTHSFADNLYLREVFIPAGTIFTTYVHKTNNPFFIMVGEILVWDNRQNKWNHINSPFRGLTRKGTKRIVYAITDTVWVTCHYNKTNTKNIEELESNLFEKYENPYLSLKQLENIQKCQG